MFCGSTREMKCSYCLLVFRLSSDIAKTLSESNLLKFCSFTKKKKKKKNCSIFSLVFI